MRVINYRLTKHQQIALLSLYNKIENPPMTFLQFRRSAIPDRLCNCVMVRYGQMWIGIEPDGYTHS